VLSHGDLVAFFGELNMKKITIIGAGFAALTAVKKLRQADSSLEITLISPEPVFVYLPGTIWIPSGIRKYPWRDILSE